LPFRHEGGSQRFEVLVAHSIQVPFKLLRDSLKFLKT
jgi:hypothetical protein